MAEIGVAFGQAEAVEEPTWLGISGVGVVCPATAKPGANDGERLAALAPSTKSPAAIIAATTNPNFLLGRYSTP